MLAVNNELWSYDGQQPLHVEEVNNEPAKIWRARRPL